MNFDLQKIVRENVKNLMPYSSARKEYSGTAQIFLDANENSFGSPLAQNYNRYPDPSQTEIKKKVAQLHNLKPCEIFVGNGSDEAIDLLFRIFCRPEIDNVLICPPTYGMYEVSAEINDAKVKRASLTNDFELDFDAIQNEFDEKTKLLFICSPNNPTGNSFDREEILRIVEIFGGIVIIDEAYIHFSCEQSFVSEINNFPNLVILQTFSKAWGLAGLRVGLALANEEIIALFNKVKPPYNVSEIAQQAILQAFENKSQAEKSITEIISERERLIEKLENFSCVKKVYPSDANFVLVKTTDAEKIYKFLLAEKIVVRNRNNVELCTGCLRITVGTYEENENLLEAISKLT